MTLVFFTHHLWFSSHVTCGFQHTLSGTFRFFRPHTLLRASVFFNAICMFQYTICASQHMYVSIHHLCFSTHVIKKKNPKPDHP
jgi:hypothetical protein